MISSYASQMLYLQNNWQRRFAVFVYTIVLNVDVDHVFHSLSIWGTVMATRRPHHVLPIDLIACQDISVTQVLFR